jgi:hypothetical protein
MCENKMMNFAYSFHFGGCKKHNQALTHPREILQIPKTLGMLGWTQTNCEMQMLDYTGYSCSTDLQHSIEKYLHFIVNIDIFAIQIAVKP